ncbi:MAG: metallophosphoesterase family protein [Thermoguttaceae bacterium]
MPRLRFFARPALFPIICLILLLVLQPLFAESWSFAVIPDTQWGSEEEPFDGTAVHVIDAINKELIRQNVDLVIQVGDLVNKSSVRSFERRNEHNQALRDAGIPYYPVRGNHDSQGVQGARDFAQVFPNLPGRPNQLGSSPDLPGTAGMTYSFVHKNVKFILLDLFMLAIEGQNRGKGYFIADYLPWIQEQLEQKDHQVVFVFSHQNLLGQNHKDNIFGGIDQDSRPDVQNAFYSLLQKNGVKYCFSGHDHIYHHSRIKSPDSQSELQEVICGSAAHKFYTPKEPFLDRETPIAQELGRIGFILVRVDDSRVQVEYYSTPSFGKEPAEPVWEQRDVFGYTLDGKEFGEPNALMLESLKSRGQ